MIIMITKLMMVVLVTGSEVQRQASSISLREGVGTGFSKVAKNRSIQYHNDIHLFALVDLSANNELPRTHVLKACQKSTFIIA